MALIKFGGGVVGMAGSIAGTTFARNRSGSYARARTKPINPNSAAQQLVRAALADLTVRWSQTLTPAQRTAWNLYAANVIMQNRLGESINLSGFNMYIRSNSLLLRAALSAVDTGPALFELPTQDPTFAITASAATQLVSVTFDNTAAWANEDDAHMFIFTGNPQNAQRNFFNGPWGYAGAIAGDAVAAPASPATFTTTQVIAEGQKLWTYGRIVRADGRLSEPFRGDVLVSA